MPTKDSQTNNNTVADATKETIAQSQEEREDAILSALGDSRYIPGATRVPHSEAWK